MMTWYTAYQDQTFVAMNPYQYGDDVHSDDYQAIPEFFKRNQSILIYLDINPSYYIV